MGSQLRPGFEMGISASDLPQGTGVDTVAILGMGGSGFAGDFATAVGERRIPVPIRVVKSYGPLPEWAGRNTLAAAVSYSGNTEETVAALTDAHSRGARTITISSGGRLEAMARELGAAHVALPGGLQPRAAIGYLCFALLGVLVAVELLPDLSGDLDEAEVLLEEAAGRCGREVPAEKNPAKD